jgi:hypothetical protein
MIRAIVAYEISHGVIQNCIYPHTGRVNDDWDPEIGNYGALFAPIVEGLFGVRLTAAELELGIHWLDGLSKLSMSLSFCGKKCDLDAKWDGNGLATLTMASGQDTVEYSPGKPVFIRSEA